MTPPEIEDIQEQYPEVYEALGWIIIDGEITELEWERDDNS